MTMSQRLSYDDVIDTAYDIFLEMAPDNLEDPHLSQFESHFDELGAAVAVDLEDDWDVQVGFAVNAQDYAEIRIGLVDEAQQQLSLVLARLLISRMPDEKFCHILWARNAE